MEHIDLSSIDKDGRFLMMCSDGLTDLYMYDDDRKDLRSLEETATHIVHVIAGIPGDFNWQGGKALYLLRDALGGQDEDKVSRNVTVDIQWRYMDDITILVQQV